jgi:hypothetical protein
MNSTQKRCFKANYSSLLFHRQATTRIRPVKKKLTLLATFAAPFASMVAPASAQKTQTAPTAETVAPAAASASLASAIIVDAPVYASDQTTVLGKIAEVAATDFILDTGTTKVKLQKTAVAKGGSGLFIGLTAEAFAAATQSGTAQKTNK